MPLTPASSRPNLPAGYGVVPATEGRGLLDWSWADERLRGRHIWWLATTRADGSPHVMPIWAVWLGDGVAFSTGGDTQKAKNIARDPRVSIVPERGVESCFVEGVVEPLDDSRKPEFYAAYLEVWNHDVSTMEEPVFIVRPKKVFGFIDENEGFPLSATRWTFD